MWFAEITNNQLFETSLLSHDLLYGIQFQQEKQETLTRAAYRNEDGDTVQATFQPYYMPDGTQTTWSGFIEDAISWGKWTVTPALRYDHITNKGVGNLLPKYNNPSVGHDYSKQSYSSFSPKLSVYYELTPDTSIFANYSYGIKAPTIREQYSVESRSATSRQLSPEKVYAARLGVLTHFSALFDQKDKLQLRMTVFDTHVKDNIARSRSKYMKVLPERRTYINHRGFDIQGIEAEMYYDAPRIFGSMNIAMMTSTYYGTIYDPNGPDIPVNDVPPPEVNMTLGYKLYESNMRFGWKGKYVHKTEETAEDIDPKAKYYTLYQPSRSYMINNLFWDWEPKAVTGLKLQLFVENIFDRQYKPYLSEGFPGMGRNVKVSATMKF